MNSAIILGRLTRDPDLRSVGEGERQTSVARFTVAVDKNLSKERRTEMEAQNKPTADFISCVAWGKLAETIVRYSRKGLRVCIEGRIETGSYQDKETGKPIYTTDLRVNSLEILDWRNNNPDQQGQAPANNQTQQPQYGPNVYPPQGGYAQGYQQPQQAPQAQGYVPIDDGSIPF